jgi:hypothetical protein
MYPEWHEVIINANMDILVIPCEESVSYFYAFRELGEQQVHQRSKYTTSRYYYLLPVVYDRNNYNTADYNALCHQYAQMILNMVSINRIINSES